MENDQFKNALIMITKKGMGSGEPELQQKLLKTYLSLLNENDLLPGAICFYTDGVKLIAEESPILDVLKKLELKGVSLIVCQTCLRFYQLENEVKAGIIGGMTDIIAAQTKASKVVSI